MMKSRLSSGGSTEASWWQVNKAEEEGGGLTEWGKMMKNILSYGNKTISQKSAWKNKYGTKINERTLIKA